MNRDKPEASIIKCLSDIEAAFILMLNLEARGLVLNPIYVEKMHYFMANDWTPEEEVTNIDLAIEPDVAEKAPPKKLSVSEAHLFHEAYLSQDSTRKDLWVSYCRELIGRARSAQDGYTFDGGRLAWTSDESYLKHVDCFHTWARQESRGGVARFFSHVYYCKAVKIGKHFLLRAPKTDGKRRYDGGWFLERPVEGKMERMHFGQVLSMFLHDGQVFMKVQWHRTEEIRSKVFQCHRKVRRLLYPPRNQSSSCHSMGWAKQRGGSGH